MPRLLRGIHATPCLPISSHSCCVSVTAASGTTFCSSSSRCGWTTELRWSRLAASASPVSAEGRRRHAAHAADASSSGLDELVLVLDLLGHWRLLGHPLDQVGVEQLVFALVMVVQRGDTEVNVISQERDPSG